jgi:hypothetical protein
VTESRQKLDGKRLEVKVQRVLVFGVEGEHHFFLLSFVSFVEGGRVWGL